MKLRMTIAVLGLAIGAACNSASEPTAAPAEETDGSTEAEDEDAPEEPSCLASELWEVDGCGACDAGTTASPDAGADDGAAEPSCCVKPIFSNGPCMVQEPNPAESASQVCLVGPDGTLYLTFMGGSVAITGAGWTHSGYGGSPARFPSTLSSSDRERCGCVLALSGTDTPVPCDEGPYCKMPLCQ